MRQVTLNWRREWGSSCQLRLRNNCQGLTSYLRSIIYPGLPTESLTICQDATLAVAAAVLQLSCLQYRAGKEASQDDEHRADASRGSHGRRRKENAAQYDQGGGHPPVRQ